MNQDLWSVDKFAEFIDARCRLLATAMNDFLDGLVPEDIAKKDLGLQIPEMIRRGESAELEFKSSLRWDIKEGSKSKILEKVIAKTVAGFTNAKGGVLLIGVDDEGVVLGLKPDYETLSKGNRDGFELHLTQVLSAALGESVLAFATITFHQIDGEDVCQVAVEASDHPVYLEDGGDSALYVRLGNLTKALPVDEAVKYVGSNW
jgi:predicted HTH transcriptional regulator